MSAIAIATRRLDANDRADLIDLYCACFPGVAVRPRVEVERKLGQLFFDGPLCEATLPSLVACDAAGRLVGFRGTLRRWWRIDGARQMGLTTTAMMVRKELRRAGVGRAMRYGVREIEAETGVRAALGYADRSTAAGRTFSLNDPTARQIYLDPYGFDWVLPLHPRALRVLRALEWRLPDAAAQRFVRAAMSRAVGALPSGATMGGSALQSAPLSPTALQEALEAANPAQWLRIDEPVETWAWLLGYLHDYPSRGRFSGRVLLGEGGAPVGFFAGYAGLAGGYELLGFAAAPAAWQAALDAVLHEAAASHALFVTGVACTQELRALLDRGAVLSPGVAASVSSPRPETVARLEAMEVLVTGLEGERWV